MLALVNIDAVLTGKELQLQNLLMEAIVRELYSSKLHFIAHKTTLFQHLLVVHAVKQTSDFISHAEHGVR